MFKVKDTRSGEIYKVYGVTHTNSGRDHYCPLFLFYEGEKWIWDYADMYEPCEEGE